MMLAMKLALLLVAIGLVGCAGDAPLELPGSKPVPPVDIALAATDLGGGAYEVRLTATPAVDLDRLSVELSLAGGTVIAAQAPQRALRGVPQQSLRLTRTGRQ